MSRRRRALSRVRRWVVTLWLPIANLIVIAAAVSVLALSKDSVSASSWASFAAGFASVLALLWLVAGYRNQSAELALQRQELQFQRRALEQQAVELSNSAKLSSLGQIKDLLERAEKIVSQSGQGISEPHEIVGLIYRGMEKWKEILESKSPKSVQESYNCWIKVEVLARKYVVNVASAMRLYFTYHSQVKFEEGEDPDTFVYVYQSWAYKAPFLSEHVGVAAMIEHHLFLLRPGIAAGQLAGMTAGALLTGRNIFKEGALEEMRDKILAEHRALPAICDPWPTFEDRRELRMPMPDSGCERDP